MDPSGGGPAAFQAAVAEATRLQDRAAELDPTSSECLAAQAQLKCMIGEFRPALTLVTNALKLVRTRDETQDIYQLYNMTKAQAQNMEELMNKR